MLKGDEKNPGISKSKELNMIYIENGDQGTFGDICKCTHIAASMKVAIPFPFKYLFSFWDFLLENNILEEYEAEPTIIRVGCQSICVALNPTNPTLGVAYEDQPPRILE